jgi:sialate O-acetylesterase
MLSFTTLLATFTLLSGLSESQVLQRDAKGVAVPTLTGTSTAEGQLLCRVNRDTWTEVTSLRGGEWQAKLPALPTGGPYLLELKMQGRDGAVLAEKSFADVYVGELWVLAGQSNMVGRARIDPSYSKDPRVRMYSVDGRWQLGAHPLHEPDRPGAGPGLEFAKERVRQTGVPIGLVPCAKGGTSMDQWSPALARQGTASLYGNLLDRVRRVGGRVTGVLWYQGENDTGTDAAPLYRQKFKDLIVRLRADLAQPNLPLYYAQLARYVNHVTKPARYYVEWNVVQEAQRAIESEVPQVKMVATIDLEHGDLIHLSRESLERVGRRFARAVDGKAGPRLAEARWASPTELRLRFSGVSGQLIAPGGRVFGFEAYNAEGKRHPLFFQASIDPANSEIVLRANRERTPPGVPEQIDLWYGRGHDPICNVVDAEDLALPMFGPFRLPARPPEPAASKN